MITDPPKKISIGDVVADPFGDGDTQEVAVGEVVADPFGDGEDEVVAKQEDPVIGYPPVVQHRDLRQRDADQPSGIPNIVPPLLARPGLDAPVLQQATPQVDAAGDDLATPAEGILTPAMREEFQQRLDITGGTIDATHVKERADLTRALDTDKYVRERPEKMVAKAAQAEQYPLFSEQAERLGPAKPYDFQNLDDPRRKTIEQDALKFAATDPTILPYSVAKMENMKEQKLWGNREEATYQGAILSHAQDVVEGKELLLKQGLDSGIIDPRHAQLIAKDIEAKKQYITAGWAAVQKIDPRTVADKLREKNKAQADLDHTIGLTGQKEAVAQSIVGGLVQGTMNTVTKPILMAYDQLFTDDDQVSGADRLINAIAEVGKDIDSYRPTAYDKPLYEKNKETGEVTWNPEGVLPQTAGAIAQLAPFIVVGGVGGGAARAIGEKATVGTAAAIFGTTYADTYDRFVRDAMEQNKPGNFISQEMAEQYANVPASVAGLVYSINPNLKTPVVMREMQAAALTALREGVGPQAAMRSVMASVLKGGGTQVGLNLAITAADNVAKNAINDVSTTGVMTLPSGQEIINGTIGAFLLGGLLGLKDNGVISGARAEGLKFAAENPEQMRKIIDGLPFANEADREMYHEQMGKLVKTYKGNGLSDMPPQQAAEIAGLLTQKSDLEQNVKEEPRDPVMSATNGDPRKKELFTLATEIARKKGLTEDETALAMASMGYLTMPEGASMKQNPDGSFTLKVKEAKEGEQGMTEEQVLKDLRSQLPPVAEPGVPGSGGPVSPKAATAPIADIDEALGLPQVQASMGPGTTVDSDGRPVHHTKEGVENFNDWFGTSVVTDDQGRPLVQYHGTRADFDEFFDPDNTADHPFLVDGFSSFPHAGTLEQANDRNNMTGRDGRKESIMPVYLSIKNPLRMNDLGGWGARTILRAVTGTELGVDPDNDLSPATLKKLEDLRDEIDEAMKPTSPEEQDQTGMESIPRPKREAEWLGKVRDILTEDGYDGIVYHNMSEGMGAIHSGVKNDSYIPFSRKQIKSARGNSGAFDKNNGSVVASMPKPGLGPVKKSTNKVNLKKALNALSKIAPGLKVIYHADRKAWAQAVEEHKDRKAELGSNGFYDAITNVIHINPAALDATQVTFHELAHPLITALAKNNPELFAKLYDELVAIDDGYKLFADKYKNITDNGRKAEAIVEFLGDVASGKVEVDEKKNSVWQKIVAWLKDMLAKMGFDIRTIDMSKPDNVREFAAEFKRAMETGITVTGVPMAENVEDLSLSKSDPSKVAKLFQENSMNAQQAEEYMRSRGVDEEVIKSVVAELATRKTAEQSAAERLAEGGQRINAPDNPVSEQVTAEARSRGVVGDGMVTVNERAALRDRLKDLAKATKEAFKKGVSEGTLAGEVGGKAEGRKEGSKESETHADRARKVMTDAVKMAIDPIKGKLTPGQSKALASAVAKTNPTSITQINKLLDNIDSIVADANYSDKLLDFKKLSGKIIAAAKSKKAQSARLAEQFAKLDAEQADIDAHISLGETILKALRVVDKDGATQPINNGELLDYINKQLDVQAQNKARDDHDELVDYALSIGGMDIPLDKIKEIRDQIDEAYAPVMKEIKRIAAEKSMDELRTAAAKAQKDLKAYRPTHAEEVEVVDKLSKMDLSKLSKDQLKDLVFTAGNIIRNNDYATARKLASKTPAQGFIEELGKETKKLGRPGTENQTLNSLDGMAITMEKIFRTPESAAHYKLLMGLEPVMNALSDARHKTEQKQARRDQIAKTHKVEDSVLNRYRAATYAYLIQNYGGTPEQQQADFETAAQNLRDSIKNINSSKTEKRHKEYLRFREQALSEILGDAKTVAELKPPAGIKAIVDNEIKEFADAKPMHDRSASMDYGERPRAVSNYTPTRTVKLFGHERGQRRVAELFEPTRGDSGVNPEMASAKHERVQKLLDGSMTDLDFFDVVDDSYQQSMEDSLGARHINVMREIFNSGSLDELMGPDTKKMLKERIHNILNSEEIARTGFGTTDKYWRRAGRISARVALSGIGQLPKQLTVGVSTAAALGKDMDLLPASYADAALAMANEESWQNKLMEGEQVHERGRVMGGVEKVGQSITREALLLGDEGDIAKYRKIIGHKVGVGADQVGYFFLKIGDVLSAQAAWFAYYKQHLRNKGVNLDDDAWKTNKDPEAASYANHMVERSQNANTIPALPEAYRQPGGTKYFLDYAMSFNSFALNTKKRQARDIKMLFTGANEDKWFAFRDLVGATLEQILFSMVQVAIAGVGLYVANGIIKMITGDDPELNKKARSYWEKVMSRAVWDTVFGGLPDAAGSAPKALINKLTHNKKKDDLFYVRRGSTLGLFDPLSEQTGMLIQGVADAFGKEETKDKQLAGVLAAVTLMNMTTLADQTLTIPFTREASRKLKKKEKKGAALFPAP